MFADAPVVDMSNTAIAGSVSTPSDSIGQAVKSAPAVVVGSSSSPSEDSVQPSDSSSVSSSDSAPAPIAHLPVDLQLKKLGQQMHNLVTMNLPAQITQLQQQVQQLSGKVAVQQHNIDLLNDQLRRFYQDLDQQINQLKNDQASPAGSNSNAKHSGSLESQETSAYQQAFALLSKQKYDEALAAFQSFVNDYPNGKYIANADYWLGQLYYVKGKFKKAENVFHLLISKYADSPKVPDAKLKLALILATQGNQEQSNKMLQSIVKLYPSTTAAKLAADQLKK